MERIGVLFVGDAEWAEFRDVHRWLAEHADLTTTADARLAIESLETRQLDPVLIVLAQRWPGEVRDRDVARLGQIAPLARISELLGSWCEGQTRSGHPLPATLRLYWHQWIARLAPEFARVAAGARPIWGLPTTATDEERLMALVDSPRKSDQGLLTIHTRSAETAAALCDASARRGFGAVWVRSRRMPYLAGIRAAIWEATRGTPDEARELAQWRSAFGGVPLVALLDFPRVEDRELVAAAGAALVVSKPFWLDDVFWQIERLSHTPVRPSV